MPSSGHIPAVTTSPLGVAYIYRRNPWVSLWWSVILPGFGHLHLGQTLKGLILMSWEILVNNQAHLNLAIFYTIRGDIDHAKAVLDMRWALIYPVFYVFTLFDSYRGAVEYNRLWDLERLQKRRSYDRVSVTALGITGLDRRSPVLAAFWSAMMVGLGHIYCNRLIKATVLMAWYLAIVLKSGLNMAVYHTVLGRFELARGGLDYQWLLFWPSVFVFAMVDAYGDAAEQNVLTDGAFRYRMRRYLRNANEAHLGAGQAHTGKPGHQNSGGEPLS